MSCIVISTKYQGGKPFQAFVCSYWLIPMVNVHVVWIIISFIIILVHYIVVRLLVIASLVLLKVLYYSSLFTIRFISKINCRPVFKSLLFSYLRRFPIESTCGLPKHVEILRGPVGFAGQLHQSWAGVDDYALAFTARGCGAFWKEHTYSVKEP